MNINNFEKYVNDRIMERGYDYYSNGNIVETYEQTDNEYVFEVAGTDNYEVIVEIDKNAEILYSECDCPYDFGPICKHQIAAYFELRDILNNESSHKVIKKEVAKQPEINEILKSLSKEELIDVIVDITKKDLTLKNSIIFRYSKGNDIEEIDKCSKLMNSIVSKYTSGEGFISYRGTSEFVNEMWELLDKAREMYNVNNNFILALDIALLVLEEAIKAFQYADDSNGEIGGLISEIIELVDEIVCESEQLDINIRKKLFDKLLEQGDNSIFDGWEDFKIDIFRICTKFADVEGFRNKFKAKIEFLVKENGIDEYKKYSNEKMLLILLSIIDKYESKESFEDCVKENLEFSSFRELYISGFMEDKNYLKVIDLALEGERKDKQYLGLVSKWKKIAG